MLSRVPRCTRFAVNYLNPVKIRTLSRSRPMMQTTIVGSAPQQEVTVLSTKGTTPVEDAPVAKNFIDTMSIYKDLKNLGFTNGQSEVILKFINESLSDRMKKLHYKSLEMIELENELYLFEAAQSELRMEVKHSREMDLRTLENEKNQFDHELKEASDELNKLMIMTKNDSEVVINEQKSENTLQQKTLKKKIQHLNNKISTNINSDVKSDIESLRWHTTRSGLFAVLVLVFSILSCVSINKRLKKEEQLSEVVLHTIEPEDTSIQETSQQLQEAK